MNPPFPPPRQRKPGWLRAAAARVATLLGRPPAPPPSPTLRLEEVRRRLEILLAGVHGREIPIVAAEVPRRGGRGEAAAANDGERIHLPPRMDASAGTEAALARYRVLALGQAERIARGTALHAPSADDPLARDLYLLMESAAADAAVVRATPGVRAALAAERAAALAVRPPLDEMGDAEREVERLLRHLLSADAADPPAELAPGATPQESRVRAVALAERLRDRARRYRGVPEVGAWGRVLTVPADGPILPSSLLPPNPFRLVIPARGKGMRPVRGGKARPGARRQVDPWGAGQGTGDPRNPQSSDEPQDSSAPEDARNQPAAGGGEGASTGGSAERVPAVSRRKTAAPEETAAYPEWDAEAVAYVPNAVRVRLHPPEEGDEAWCAAVLAAHGPLVRRLRERFERLRAHRTRLYRQRDGADLDLEACVRAFADRVAGHAIDDRMYAAVRPARRALAIELLVDISGSTSEPVGRRRIIDIEKIALLLTSEALDALGDRYAVHTFSGTGAENVRLRTVKEFGERNGAAVRRRIAALRPEGYTRLGAAVRHATALLTRQSVGHRLLLILSDGRPNDQDHYQGRYAVEDARQAIMEARARGVHPFCLTVDRTAAAYLGRIFGEPGHVVLRHPDQLPLALVRVVRQILRNR